MDLGRATTAARVERAVRAAEVKARVVKAVATATVVEWAVARVTEPYGFTQPAGT